MGTRKVMSSDLFRKLQVILEKMKKELLKTNFKKVEKLSRQAGTVVEELRRSRQTETDKGRKQILELYRQLILITSAHRKNVGEQLQHVGDGKKVIGVYGDNV